MEFAGLFLDFVEEEASSSALLDFVAFPPFDFAPEDEVSPDFPPLAFLGGMMEELTIYLVYCFEEQDEVMMMDKCWGMRSLKQLSSHG